MVKADKPSFQEFHIEGIKHISPEDAYAAAMRGEAYILDVREECESKNRIIEGEAVIFHPMSGILNKLALLPKDKTIIVVCVSGERSCKIVNLLKRNDFADVVNLDGGLMNWAYAGLPLKSKFAVDHRCGCNSGDQEADIELKGCGSGCGSGCC
jgi:rhodanese-related sulfurtransferase